MPLRYDTEIDGAALPFLLDDGPDGWRVVPLGEDGPPGPAQAVEFSLAQSPGVYSLLVDGESWEVYIEPDPETPHTWWVALGRWRFAVTVQTERERRLARVTEGKVAHTGAVTVKAPMPGLVREVAVKPGDTVSIGQRLVVLEAMKMENDIAAPRAGVVQSVGVRAGETVDGGRVLVVLE